MKKIYLLSVVVLSLMFTACSSDDSDEGNEPILVGQDGNPRFNLQFTNAENVDLDLYVQTPSGAIIYYANKSADEGTLDIDCLCSACPQGPNENIFWENGTAPSGTYTYWVKYYSSCTGGSPSSDFTLRIIRNGSVLETKTGTLTTGITTKWTFQHSN